MHLYVSWSINQNTLSRSNNFIFLQLSKGELISLVVISLLVRNFYGNFNHSRILRSGSRISNNRTYAQITCSYFPLTSLTTWQLSSQQTVMLHSKRHRDGLRAKIVCSLYFSAVVFMAVPTIVLCYHVPWNLCYMRWGDVNPLLIRYQLVWWVWRHKDTIHACMMMLS